MPHAEGYNEAVEGLAAEQRRVRVLRSRVAREIAERDFVNRRLEQAEAVVTELEARLAKLEAALKNIAEHPHCDYASGFVTSQTPSSESYGIGVADGHRCAANRARAALAAAPPAPTEPPQDAQKHCCEPCNEGGPDYP